MNPATIVRPAALDDVPALARLVREYWAFEDIPGYDAARIERLLATLIADESRGGLWIALAGEQAVGYLLASYVFSLEHGGTMAEIDEFYVEARQRGAGVGAALLSAAEQHMNTRGLVRLQLQLGRDNDGGRRFYVARGFAPREGFDLWDKALARTVPMFAVAVAALLLAGCANVPRVEAPPCARPAPLLGQYDGRAPGYQVHMRDANGSAARELLQRHGLKARDVSSKGDWIALEKVKPSVIAQLRCEPTVESITYDAYLGRLVR